MEPTKKEHTDQVRRRFLEAMDYIIRNEVNGVSKRGEFAARVGEYQQNLPAMERGERFPTIENCVLLCLEFGISPSWLFLENGEMLGKMDAGSINNLLKRLSSVEKKVEQLEADKKKKVK